MGAIEDLRKVIQDFLAPGKDEIMTNHKKPRSKPAPAKKAVRNPQPLALGPDPRLIDGIAARVEELAAELAQAAGGSEGAGVSSLLQR